MLEPYKKILSNNLFDKEFFLYTFGLLIRIITGPAVALTIATKVSPLEQGVYYLFISVYSLVSIFEAGMGVVASQQLSKFAQKVKWYNKHTISNSSHAHKYIHAIIAITIIWQIVVAIALLTIINTVGYIILDNKNLPFDWLAQWEFYLIANVFVILGGASIIINEGLFRRDIAYKIQLIGSAINAITIFLSLLFNLGLYSIGLASLVSGFFTLSALIFSLRGSILTSVSLLFKFDKNKPYVYLVIKKCSSFFIKLAATWAGGYFYWNSFILFSFILLDPVTAGQVGLSMSLARAGLALSESGVQTKRTIFVNLLANGMENEAKKIFQNIFLKFLVILTTGYFGFIILLEFAPFSISSRLLSPSNLALLFIDFIILYYITIHAVYLRSTNTEPLLFCSAFQNIMTPFFCYFTLHMYGIEYFLVSLFLLNIISAFWVNYIYKNQDNKLSG